MSACDYDASLTIYMTSKGVSANNITDRCLFFKYDQDDYKLRDSLSFTQTR